MRMQKIIGQWTTTSIPVVEIYRGVGIEDQQPPERIELVKREIDRVHRMSGPTSSPTTPATPAKPA